MLGPLAPITGTSPHPAMVVSPAPRQIPPSEAGVPGNSVHGSLHRNFKLSSGLDRCWWRLGLAQVSLLYGKLRGSILYLHVSNWVLKSF